MSDNRDWKIRVNDILDCIAKINLYTKNLTFETFNGDNKTIDAVIRNFEIIGEAAGHIPIEIQEKYPELAWFEMRGMRNILAHEYFGVSHVMIWHTIQHDLPSLAEGMRKILRD